MINIILLGPPGAGKGTQSKFIVKKYGIKYISSGNLLRNIVNSGDKLGKKIKNIINEGKLIEDKLIIDLIKRDISKRCHNGFLLDGFPRTLAQANALKSSGLTIDLVLELDVPDESIINRITGRRVHPSSGRIYHIKFNPPKIKERDDLTGDKLIIRKDDKKKIVLKRLNIYHECMNELINFYTKESQDRNLKFFKIKGDESIKNTFLKIENILNELMSKNM